MQNNKPFAEVIQSSLHEFTAQSWQWNHFAPFGSLVIIENKTRTIYGLVHQVNTGSMDPMRYPFAYQKTHEELLEEQPQIFEFLKTTFQCLIIGYKQKGTTRYLLAPEPPEIHSFIAPITQEEARIFFSLDSYLPLIFNTSSSLSSLDELLLALLAQQKELGILQQEQIKRFIGSFSLLTGNDYRRLKLFLQRAKHIVEI